jgi:hypothetical protein
MGTGMCERLKTPQGGVMIVCGLRSSTKRCVHCGHEGQFLCDWKITGRLRKRTCDRAICATHALEVAPGKHLCGEHQRAYEDWKRRHGADAASVLMRRQPEQMSLIP